MRPRLRTVNSVSPVETTPPGAFSLLSRTACSTSSRLMPQCAHAVRIELHLVLPQHAAEPLDARHAWHRQNAIAQIEFRDVAELHRIDVAFDEILVHLVEAVGETRQQAADECLPAAAEVTCASRSVTSCRARQ